MCKKSPRSKKGIIKKFLEIQCTICKQNLKIDDSFIYSIEYLEKNRYLIFMNCGCSHWRIDIDFRISPFIWTIEAFDKIYKSWVHFKPDIVEIKSKDLRFYN